MYKALGTERLPGRPGCVNTGAHPNQFECPDAAYVMVWYGDLGAQIPGIIAPLPPGKDGSGLPKACGDSLRALSKALSFSRPVPVDVDFTLSLQGEVDRIASKHGIPYDGTAQGITPQLCEAIIYEIKSSTPPVGYWQEGGWWNTAPGGTTPVKPGRSSSGAASSFKRSAAKKFAAVAFQPTKKKKKKTEAMPDVGGGQQEEPGWWGSQPMWVKGAIIVGGLGVVGGGIYLATKK